MPGKRLLFTLALVALGSTCSFSADWSGTLLSNVTWTAAENPHRVTSNLILSNGLTLRVEPGVMVRMAAGASIHVRAGATLDVAGAAAAPAQFLPASAGVAWGNLSASGHAASIVLRHVEIERGGITISNRATALIEDAFIHDVQSAILASASGPVTLRRSHLRNYTETFFFVGVVVLVEDSLFENLLSPSSDALEILDGSPGSVIRRCTFRNGLLANTDAIDLNNSTNVLIQDCLIYNFTDKGLSLGNALEHATTRSAVISNTLIYACGDGVAVKDRAEAVLQHVTVANCNRGLRLYQRSGTPQADAGGRVTAGTGNIVWANNTGLELGWNSTLQMSHSDIQGTNWPGTGNLSVDPEFVNATARDYQLALTSPARRTAANGGNMGVSFTVGAPFAPSHPALSITRNAVGFWADSARQYQVELTPSIGQVWLPGTNIAAPDRPRWIELPASAIPAAFFRVRSQPR
jgi:hypothetical protein